LIDEKSEAITSEEDAIKYGQTGGGGGAFTSHGEKGGQHGSLKTRSFVRRKTNWLGVSAGGKGQVRNRTFSVLNMRIRGRNKARGTIAHGHSEKKLKANAGGGRGGI